MATAMAIAMVAVAMPTTAIDDDDKPDGDDDEGGANDGDGGDDDCDGDGCDDDGDDDQGDAENDDEGLQRLERAPALAPHVERDVEIPRRPSRPAEEVAAPPLEEAQEPEPLHPRQPRAVREGRPRPGHEAPVDGERAKVRPQKVLRHLLERARNRAHVEGQLRARQEPDGVPLDLHGERNHLDPLKSPTRRRRLSARTIRAWCRRRLC